MVNVINWYDNCLVFSGNISSILLHLINGYVYRNEDTRHMFMNLGIDAGCMAISVNKNEGKH